MTPITGGEENDKKGKGGRTCIHACGGGDEPPHGVKIGTLLSTAPPRLDEP